MSRLVTHAHPRTSTRSPTHTDTHTHRYRSISLVCNQDRRTLRAITAGQRLRSGSCQGGLQFSIDRKMNGTENVRRKCGKMCGKSTCQPQLFTRISVCRFGFQVPALVSCEKRSEIRDCTQLLPNKTGLSSTTTMVYMYIYI